MPLTPTASIIDRGTGGGTGSSNAQLFVNAWILRKFVETLDFNAQLAKIPRDDTLPIAQGADTVRWIQFAPLTANITPLVEGTDPTDSVAVPSTQVEGFIEQYGDYIETSDIFPLVAITGSIAAMVERLSRQAVDTVDTLVRNEAKNTTNFVVPDGIGGTLLAGQKADTEILRLASEFFQTNNVEPHPATMGGKYFFTVFHPAQSWDLQADAGWIDAVKHVAPGTAGALDQDGSATQGASNIWNGSPGVFAGHQIAISTNIDTATVDTINAYNALSFGREGLGHVALSSNIVSPQIIIRKPGPQTLSSPLGMRMTWGWKINYVVKIIDETQVQLIHSAV